MKKLIIASTAACGLAIAAVPAMADHHMEDGPEMTAAQKSMYDGWTAEQRTTYDAWPPEGQEYYWTLDADQQSIWWDSLNDEQRVRIVTMAPQQRMAAWQSINSQLGGRPATATPTRTTTTGNVKINYRSNAVVQPTPGDEGPPPADLPICEPQEQDNCINRGAV